MLGVIGFAKMINERFLGAGNKSTIAQEFTQERHPEMHVQSGNFRSNAGKQLQPIGNIGAHVNGNASAFQPIQINGFK